MAKKSVLILTFLWLGLLNSCLAADYSGLWWDPSRDGQGLSLIHHQGSICGAWFLYDSSGKDMWLVFTASLNSHTSFTTQLFQYTGPALGTTWDITKIKSSIKGTISMTFNGTNNATMQYNVDGVRGTMTLQPFANDVASFYWDTDKPGQGIAYFIEGENAYLIWYLYDERGENMWLTSGLDLSQTSLSGNLYQFSGPPLGSTWDTTLVNSSAVGTMNFDTNISELISFSYNIKDTSGELELVSFEKTNPKCANSTTETLDTQINSGNQTAIEHDSNSPGSATTEDTNQDSSAATSDQMESDSSTGDSDNQTNSDSTSDDGTCCSDNQNSSSNNNGQHSNSMGKGQ